jgi:hypothetical protein
MEIGLSFGGLAFVYCAGHLWNRKLQVGNGGSVLFF